MPMYTYECPECGLAATLWEKIARRDKVACHRCSLFHGKEMLMRRLPDAPNFSIQGYNAKNGYSNEG